MKRIILLWCLLGLLVPGMAQQALHGRVVSATDRTPLPGATVTLQHTAVGVVTDADGSFTLPAVQAGTPCWFPISGMPPPAGPAPAPAPFAGDFPGRGRSGPAGGGGLHRLPAHPAGARHRLLCPGL
ncbi:carboxypeptidase-like regulatory domain-containing protein [Pontibacter rugosus]